MNVVIIQPPLVQLNTPYPAGAYLKAFFDIVRQDYPIIENVSWLDLSNELFHSIFSAKGLKKLFTLSEKRALKMANDYENQGDENSAFQLRRYISLQDEWAFWIDRIVEIVCGGASAREYCHEFVRSPHVPRGSRMENFLYNLGREVTSDDAQILASFALADLADYITLVFDKNFRLISYAEKLGTSEASFENVIEGLKSPVLVNFYDEVLSDSLKHYFVQNPNGNQCETLFLITVPFPGCFEAAIYSAKKIREMMPQSTVIGIGGGYVNTELRNVCEPKLFDYVDFLSYDMGYGSYLNLLDKAQEKGGKIKPCFDGVSMYRNKYFYEGNVVNPLQKSLDSETKSKNYEFYEQREAEICKTLVPDFGGIDFSKYPRLADDVNPMHRIWNDGAWLKAYLAHGCYWHRCKFCDTMLEYVNRFCKCNVCTLCDGLTEQSQKTGVWGVHFVDEACPPASLVEFGLRNCENSAKTGKKLTFWGNIRFEKTFTRDMANLLSYSGMTAVSGGIEIATGDGLNSVDKGTTLENIVKACCAFKEAGILVHSYMIFGFYNQSEQDLINSMETLRQLFKAGLLDSAFWHKFTLTLHSTIYKEWKEGKHPELKILQDKRPRFAENDLHFEGEQKSQKYSRGLNDALDLWMHGEKLDENVTHFFDFKMPHPTVAKNLIEMLISKYEFERDSACKKLSKKRETYVWLGGKVISSKRKINWFFMGENFECDCENSVELSILLESLKPEKANFGNEEKQSQLIHLADKKVFEFLRSAGLCKI